MAETREMAERAEPVEARSTQEARRQIQATRNRISRDLDALERRLNSATGGLGTHWARRLRRRVRREPVEALGVAFGIGVAAGLAAAAGTRRRWVSALAGETRRHVARALREAVGG